MLVRLKINFIFQIQTIVVDKLGVVYLLGPKLSTTVMLRESIKKTGLVMEIFRKGSDPPFLPLIFGSYGTREAQFNFCHKKGKN